MNQLASVKSLYKTQGLEKVLKPEELTRLKQKSQNCLSHQKKSKMIKFHPKAGQILMCDFEGFIAPEMPIASPKYQMG